MFPLIGICLLVFKVNNGNRTMWSPIRSVSIRVISRESDLLITSMITDKIGRFEVLLSINHITISEDVGKDKIGKVISW